MPKGYQPVHAEAIKSFRNLQNGVNFVTHTFLSLDTLRQCYELDAWGVLGDFALGNMTVLVNDYFNPERVSDQYLDRLFDANPKLRGIIEKVGANSVNGYEDGLQRFSSNMSRLYGAGHRLCIFGGRLIGHGINMSLSAATNLIGRVADAAEHLEQKVEASTTPASMSPHSKTS